MLEENVDIAEVGSLRELKVVESPALVREDHLSLYYEVDELRHLSLIVDYRLVAADADGVVVLGSRLGPFISELDFEVTSGAF